GAEGMDIEADVFAALAIAVAFERPDLVEGGAKIIASKRLVLVELQPVLFVQLQRQEFIEGHRSIDFVSGIESGKNRVRAFAEATHAFRVAGHLQVRDGRTEG